MLVTGDSAGFMRIFDVRSMKSIMEWKGQPSCSSQFSFDENSIYSVNNNGELCQWSIHKPGTCIFTKSLEGFPPSIALSITPSSVNDNHIPIRSLFPSTLPRRQMVAFSAETDYVLCAASSKQTTYGSIYQVLSSEDTSSTSSSSSIFQFGCESIEQQNITTVDWTTHTSNITCLLGSVDGSVKVTTLIKV
ncbi:MAG: hypothetical protein EXX96DRAFT_110525 [Benjaminiella poitrasii]|nr:MAG: hypothetical protein EXX96DRAFT_110525 [Benjaminiella poitrasii]